MYVSIYTKHETRNTKHDVFVYRVPISNPYIAWTRPERRHNLQSHASVDLLEGVLRTCGWESYRGRLLVMRRRWEGRMAALRERERAGILFQAIAWIHKTFLRMCFQHGPDWREGHTGAEIENPCSNSPKFILFISPCNPYQFKIRLDHFRTPTSPYLHPPVLSCCLLVNSGVTVKALCIYFV